MHQRLEELTGRRRLRHRDAARDLTRLPDPAVPAGTDRVPQIRHVVILMMENHSFDNYLGTLGHGDGLPDPPPTNPAADGRPVAVRHFRSVAQREGAPSQSWRASHVQWGEGANDGFVRSVEELDVAAPDDAAMGYWDADDLPFYADLARTFPLADRWFCSCLGPTFPNRRFLVSGTANGLIDDELASIIDYPRGGTLFDLLDRYGVSWANYHHGSGRELSRTRFLAGGRLQLDRRARLLGRHLFPGVVGQVRGQLQCTANLYPLGFLRIRRHLLPVERFFAEAEAGTLPAVSIVDPDFEHASEENPQDVQLGEGFAAAVVDAVLRGPGWRHTLLVWLYDEHGGYYDHVPPPAAVEPDGVRPRSLLDAGQPLRWLLRHSGLGRHVREDDVAAGRYDRLGFRVPAVLISPWSKPGFVSSEVYDHTSVLKLIEEKWNLPPLTERDAAARAPWDMVDLEAAPAFADAPTLAPPARRWPDPGTPGARRSAGPASSWRRATRAVTSWRPKAST